VGLLITVIVVYVFWGDVPFLLDFIAAQCRCRLFRDDLEQPDLACFVLSSHLPEKAGCFESRGFLGKVESRHCSVEVVGTVRLGVADCERSRHDSHHLSRYQSRNHYRLATQPLTCGPTF
jgi:hypothetical protein